MKRTPLSIGSTIQDKSGSSYTYVIDRVIGDGASSIVYEAHYTDNAYGRHDVRLKECYPYASDIQRIGTDLVWADTATATNDKVAFTTAYNKLLDFQNTTNLRNSTAHIFDLCEANGTLYSVMDVNEGQTFDQDNSKKLSDILKTTLALARVVEKYHNNGYLHLDIKPSNFLVIPETRELVILFDVDSVTPMDDIASGKIKCVPFSKGWAAPEQMQGQINKLCPATDIYSIGAILFQKVMGRAVENNDIGIFADWEFDGRIFEGVNPKIKRLLRDIFHKTLAANSKRRYQHVYELIAALEEAVEAATQPIYLSSDYPISAVNFVGRKQELVEMQNAYTNGKRVLFLSGIGGIGKTELALQYASLQNHTYDAIVFLRYQESLKDALLDVSIENFFSDNFNEHLRMFKTLLRKQKVLLIIDNFDNDGSDPFLKEVLSFQCDLLFTTRCHFVDVFSNWSDIAEIEIEELSKEEQFNLFANESGIDIFNDDNRKYVIQLLEIISGYTLLISLIAKQYRRGIKTLNELCDVYKEAGLRGGTEVGVKHFKDGSLLKGSVYSILTSVLKMDDFFEKEKLVMRSVCALESARTTKRFLIELLGAEHVDTINDLIDRGWLIIDGTADTARVYEHKIISSLCKEELRITASGLCWLQKLIEALRKDGTLALNIQQRKELGDQRLETERLFKRLILSVFKHMDMTDSKTVCLILKTITKELNRGDLTEVVFNEINQLLEMVFRSEGFSKLNIYNQVFTYVFAADFLWSSFCLDKNEKNINVDSLVEYYQNHLDKMIMYSQKAELLGVNLSNDKRRKVLKRLFTQVIYDGCYDCDIYAIYKHIVVSKDYEEKLKEIIPELKKICERHISYIAELPYRVFSFEEYPEHGMPHKLRCYLEEYCELMNLDNVGRLEDDSFDGFLEESLKESDNKLDDKRYSYKCLLQQAFGEIFKKHIELEKFQASLEEFVEYDNADSCSDYVLYDSPQSYTEIDSFDDENGYDTEFNESKLYNISDDEYYSAYCSDPIHELTELFDIYDVPDDVVDICQEDYEDYEREEYTVPQAEMKISFLLDELIKWGCDPFSYDSLMQIGAYQDCFYIERLPLIADVIYDVLSEGNVEDEELKSKAYAYCALIYSVVGNDTDAEECALQYAQASYTDYDQVQRVYLNIRTFNDDVANEMAQKCIELLESNENIDSYMRVHAVEKYSRLCGDKEKFEFYKNQRAKLIEERTGFSFIEF